MGMQSIILGYIEEAWPGYAAGEGPADLEDYQAAVRAIGEHNEGVLLKLPEGDAFPPLCRPMFAWPPVGSPLIAYRGRLIHFAASMNQVDGHLRDWLDKFEGLLRQMYWEGVFIRVQTAYMGTYEFRWRVDDQWAREMSKGNLRPITKWTFASTMDEAVLSGLRGGK